MGTPDGMKVVTTPAVYLLSKQTLQRGELDRFLADHGVSWGSDSEVPAEVVAEVAGRVCYMSFANPRPGGNAGKLANVLLDVLVKDSPNLFGDYERTPLPDGTFEITTAFPKV